MIPTETISGLTLNSLLFYSAILSALLLLGVFLRTKLRFLKRLFIPASLIAGVIGLILGPYGVKIFSEEMTSSWGSMAGILITIVFAPMLMGIKGGLGKTGKNVIRHLGFGYIGIMLQVAVPLIVTSLILIPMFQVSDLFGSLIEVGWAGGHGTAAGMTEVYHNLSWEEGASLAVTSATIGIIVGIISGTIIINHGVRKGYTSIIKDSAQLQSTEGQYDFIKKEKQMPSSYRTINQDVVESLAFHMSLIGVSIIIGWFLQQIIIIYVPGVPLFPLAMIGGLIVNSFINLLKMENYVDLNTMRSIQGFALDFLIIGAVASIKIPVVIEFAFPLAILSIITTILMIFYFYYLGRRMFPEDWFENAIVHYGSYTGVAAIGLMLLRTVDPEMKTDSGKSYALHQPFLGPFVGGGLITSIIPLMILKYSSLYVGLFALLITILIIIFYRITGLISFTKFEDKKQHVDESA